MALIVLLILFFLPNKKNNLMLIMCFNMQKGQLLRLWAFFLGHVHRLISKCTYLFSEKTKPEFCGLIFFEPMSFSVKIR